MDTSRRAKYLIIHTEKGYIIGHLGMSGSVRIVPHDSPIDKHDHLDIVMNNGNYCVITTLDALGRGYGLKA